MPRPPECAPSPPLSGVGIGFRPELAADLLSAPGAVDFVEIVAEACFSSQAARREASAIARIWPVVPHGVKLSLGSATGIDPERARRLGALCRELGAPAVSEHVAFVRGGDREIGHLTALPYTIEAARVVAWNVAAARKALPDIPLLLENAACTLRFPESALDEGSFYAEIVARTGCDLLLDVGNLYANAVNAGVDPAALARSYPLDRVAMIHIAGGVREHGFYFDTHAHPVPEPVFALLAAVLDRTGPVPILLERDGDFPPSAALAAEIAAAREIARAAPPRPPRAAPGASPQAGSAASPDAPALAAAQAHVAALLTAPSPPSPDAARPFDAEDVARSRAILQRKRVDDALPLLPRLSSHRDAAARLGARCVEAWPRAPRLTAVADAVRLAEAAQADARLAPEAIVDRLLLRARFVGPAGDGGVRPRLLPFVRRERLPGGRVVWALKGIGAGADVRLLETRG
ncbi:hypothetical protein SOCEGT47_017140 [Sorangium cellulosum]|uniref:DUF692 domain-containing protein n=1 Tax=Sorangium cellulosum TaxID=56 RepID=A0A4P2PWQ8_SORCE|nr:DUF692 domain-containing protein [Sorangium cellulosum]AUX21234.1 hypothetical protein SOCEGT47_017140 [Sorangium cellulosum]